MWVVKYEYNINNKITIYKLTQFDDEWEAIRYVEDITSLPTAKFRVYYDHKEEDDNIDSDSDSD